MLACLRQRASRRELRKTKRRHKRESSSLLQKEANMYICAPEGNMSLHLQLDSQELSPHVIAACGVHLTGFCLRGTLLLLVTVCFPQVDKGRI